MKKVAIIGIQGVPANYGGFETLTENLLDKKCSQEIVYTVFCSGKDMQDKITMYKNAKLDYIPLHANGAQSIPYDIVAMIRSIGKYDAVLILGVSGCLFMPVFRLLFRKKIIVNIDGLEHRRAKWGKIARRILKWSESMAVKYADVIISDNKGIQDYVIEEYSKHSIFIAYGGDQVNRCVTVEKQNEILDRYGIKNIKYAIALCRIEPENNCALILSSFAESGKELVFIGNWERSRYSRDLKNMYGTYKNIHLISSLYDLDSLFVLRSKCTWYVHGHGAGGTNPSLVEAMFFGKPILAFDVIYNRGTTQNKAFYFKDKETLSKLLLCTETEMKDCGARMLSIAKASYQWKDIVKQYEDLF